MLEGRTLILVTHRGSMLSLVDRLVVMDQGRIVADGPRDKVVADLQSGAIRNAARAG
jgi:ATP-binding cassette subfamily C protein LapB